MKKENERMRAACNVIGNASALARLLCVSRATVSEWCNGRRPVPPGRALQIDAMTKERGNRVSAELIAPESAEEIAFMRHRAKKLK